jgi:ubiquinone biosynthesis protein Coq4
MSEKDRSSQIQRYQDEIHNIKTEWMGLRDQNKQNLRKIEKLEDALTDIKF